MAEPIDDPNFDAKAFVARGYDQCGAAYTAARGAVPPLWLPLISDRLPDGAAVLDVGCGSGIPVAKALAARFAVIGVDISFGQIERARRHVPHATFVHGDIMSQAFGPEVFAAVVMIYTLFHLPRDEHPELLRRIHAWLQPNGLLLVTLACTSHPGYVENDFCGASMYWSHFAEPEYYPTLERAGFEVLEKQQIGHGYVNVANDTEVYSLILARKSG